MLSRLPQDAYSRFQQMQTYVGWTPDDPERIRRLLPLVRPHFPGLISDFYAAIQRDVRAARVITGGAEQIQRLKGTLTRWLEELFSGQFDQDYIERRWKVGWRHVEIGLDQVYTNLALARLREGLLHAILENWTDGIAELGLAIQSLNRALDLDLAIILDAYAAEYNERQRQSERLRSEAAFYRLVETAGVMIVILRDNHSIAFMNPFAEEVTGYLAAEIASQNFLTLFLPAGAREGLAKEFRRILAGKSTRGYENAVVCRGGSKRWIVWNGQRLDDYQGAPAVVMIGQDITTRKDAEERALRSERLAAIGQTVAGLAHESRNAFQRSQACLELLQIELEGRPDQLELVERIQRSLNHLHRLYEEVRDYAAPVKLDRQACDLSHLWRDSWSHLDMTRASKSVELQEDLQSGDLTCTADWFALGQVFRNIFENAIAACPESGLISVRAGHVKLEGQQAIRVSIKDNGAGIDPDARERVFDPFFTTKPKGTGLGMAIARRIVEAHGGTIEIGDQPGGAEFIITLPV
ncbi:MAG: protoglobin domain-containing protein [Pirellulaceae bacterium]